MTQLHLVRHGTHTLQGRIMVGRTAGVHLSPEGKAEVERAAAWLARAGLDALYSSPLERARETARHITDRTGLAAEIASAATEVDYGDWTGFSWEQLQGDPRFADWNRLRSVARAPGGEMLAEVQARGAALTQELYARHPDATIALVSHGDTIKAILAQCLGIPLEFFFRLEISPGSISTVELRPSVLRVLRINLMAEEAGPAA